MKGAMIEVTRASNGDPFNFDVIVREGGGESRHHVTMGQDTWERLTAGKHTPERCLEAAFRFLLDREPKESILGLHAGVSIKQRLGRPKTDPAIWSMLTCPDPFALRD